MALKRDTRYPGRFVAANAAHPQGAFKNRTTPTAQDGSYLEADWMNDIDGFFARALNIAGTTLNGNPDTGTSSQLFDAVVAATPGRFLNLRVLTNTGTYLPTAGTTKIMVEVVGGGAAGGGSAATGASQQSAGGGGGAGAYVMGIFTSGFSSVNYTVGSGGTGVTGGQGGNGSGSSFLTLSAGGGFGAPAGIVSVGGGGAGGNGGVASGGLINSTGAFGNGSTVYSTSFAGSGAGGASRPYPGGNGSGRGTVGNGIAATEYGCGGGGSNSGPSGAARTGANGTSGVIFVWEYS